jgi:hypothetical protein
VSDKTGWKGRGQQLRDSTWARRDRVPSPGPGQRKYSCAGVPKRIYSVGLLGAKTEIPAQQPLRLFASSAIATCAEN